MTDEVKTEEVVVSQEPQALSQTEEDAVSEGWQTKDDWVASGKPEDEWRSAREFKDRGELLRKVKDISSELNSTRSTLTALKGHYDKVRDTEFKRALEALKSEKRDALVAGDADAVVAIDEDIEKVREEQRKEKAEAVTTQAPEIHPDFSRWVVGNAWYETSTEMRAFADSIGRAYAVSNPGVQPVEVLKYVSTKVKQAYPDKFTNPNRSKSGGVEASSPNQKKGANSISTVELDEDERKTMAKFVKSGLMTEKEYMDDLKKIKERK